MNRYRREVPLEKQDWRAEPYLGPHSMEDRDRLVLALDRQRPEEMLEERLRVPPEKEFRPGYLERLREKIAPKTAEEEPVVRRLRSMGQR